MKNLLLLLVAMNYNFEDPFIEERFFYRKTKGGLGWQILVHIRI